ncbi:MAG: Arc family DNA binding domain-containing protein [Gemmatimonadota bacterium]
MSEKKAFLLRTDPALLDALQRWADDDLRSLNAQIDFLLRAALAKAGRAPKAKPSPSSKKTP